MDVIITLLKFSAQFEIINNQKSIENDKVYSFGYQMKISKAKKILWVGDLIKMEY
ncbi:MAG: hypothetical protein IPI04_08940 [Ignavibacteria bacterium]|nr:hypothetical protein [Ignavibacteria bacterium]